MFRREEAMDLDFSSSQDKERLKMLSSSSKSAFLDQMETGYKWTMICDKKTRPDNRHASYISSANFPMDIYDNESPLDFSATGSNFSSKIDQESGRYLERRSSFIKLEDISAPVKGHLKSVDVDDTTQSSAGHPPNVLAQQGAAGTNSGPPVINPLREDEVVEENRDDPPDPDSPPPSSSGSLDDEDDSDRLKKILQEVVEINDLLYQMPNYRLTLRTRNVQPILYYGTTGVGRLVQNLFAGAILSDQVVGKVVSCRTTTEDVLVSIFAESLPAIFVILDLDAASNTLVDVISDQMDAIANARQALTIIATAGNLASVRDDIRLRFHAFLFLIPVVLGVDPNDA